MKRHVVRAGRACSNATKNARRVRYVNGSRAVITTETNSTCAATFNPGAGGDFQI